MKRILRDMIGLLPKKTQEQIFFLKNFKRLLHLNPPRSFSEKVIHRKLYDKNPIYTKLADKYLAREYIKEKIGSQYLIPLIHCTDDPDELRKIADWSNLVIKPNHGAGMVLFTSQHPSLEEKEQAIATCKSWLDIDFSESANEWHYKNINRKLLVEESICSNGKPPNDYKFHCFPQGNGEVMTVLQVVNDRFGKQSRGYYLNSLEHCVWSHGDGNHHIPESDISALNTALDFCGILSRDFSYVRVDWYVSHGNLYFGELTFTPGAGRSNEFGDCLESQMLGYWKNN